MYSRIGDSCPIFVDKVGDNMFIPSGYLLHIDVTVHEPVDNYMQIGIDIHWFVHKLSTYDQDKFERKVKVIHIIQSPTTTATIYTLIVYIIVGR